MDTPRKAWRDMYFFFKEAFEGERIYGPMILTAWQLCDLLKAKFPGEEYNVYELELLLGKYFRMIEPGQFGVTKSHYPELLFEIHNPELPEWLLPPRFNKHLTKNK